MLLWCQLVLDERPHVGVHARLRVALHPCCTVPERVWYPYCCHHQWLLQCVWNLAKIRWCRLERLKLYYYCTIDGDTHSLHCSDTDPGLFPLVMVGQTVASISNLLLWTGPSFLSSVWFSPTERAISTAIAGAIGPQVTNKRVVGWMFVKPITYPFIFRWGCYLACLLVPSWCMIQTLSLCATLLTQYLAHLRPFLTGKKGFINDCSITCLFRLSQHQSSCLWVSVRYYKCL